MLANGKVLENAIEDIFFETKMKHAYKECEKESTDYLFVANYSENKNHKMLIDAFAKAEIGRSNLIFAGFEANRYLDSLRNYSDQLFALSANKKVVYNVHLEREQIIDLYKNADVFVCPSKSETWSIVAHEAAAAAMPIISTDVGIYSEIEGAIIVHSVEEMKEAMETLCHDFGERKSHGEAAYRWLNSKECRIKDKVDWLEKELVNLCEEEKK